MPTLLEYINQLQREHRYRIKMAFQPSERQLEVLERHMKKYDALEVGRPEKLMLQAQPMDFPSLGGHEIVIVDVVTRLPISTPVLQEELRSLMFVKDGMVKVFGRDEPVQQDIEAQEEGKEQADPITGAEYRDAEGNPVKAADAAGDSYNQTMLKDLDKVNKDRKDNITQGVGEITSGPEYNSPEDGKASPLSSVKNPMPTAKGAK